MGDVDTDLLRLNTPSLHQCLDLPGKLNRYVIHIDVIPCAGIGDHDGPHARLNIRAERFVQRCKFICCERNIPLQEYLREIDSHHLCSGNPHKILKLFNTLVPECREGRAPSKRRKLNRPPSHRFNTDESREVRNQLKQKIEQARKS